MIAKRQSDPNGESDSDNEFKDGAMVKRKSRGGYEDPATIKLEMPLSVKAVINKIEQAQLLRAKEAILSRLIEIMSKVELIMTRYAIESTSPGKRGSISESQRKKRKVLLEKIAAHVKSIDIREKILTKLLSWLEEWNFVLSEVPEIDVDEYHHWIAQMELLPEMVKEMDSSINTVCQITTLLIEEKKRQKKKLVTRGTLWKAWKERVVKRPAAAHALRPDQMICDQLALNTKVSEIQDMLQELISSAMLTKLENNAIKYISATVLNLSKALNTVSDELKLMTFQVTNVGVSEEKETEKDFSQKVIQELSKENEMLHQKLRDSEEKCDQLIRIKNFLGRQLLVPSTPSLRMLVVGSPQAPISKDVDAGEIDSLLNKELEKIIDESQTKGVRATAIKWDSSMTYVAQSEMAVDVAKQQAEDKADQDQKKQYSPVPPPAETSDTNLEKEEKKVMEVASSQFSDLQALDMKRKDRKSFLEGTPQGQEVKSGASSLWERFKKGRSEHSLGKSPASPEIKVVPHVKPPDKVPPDKESKTEVEQTKASQPESTPEPPKIETKGKKPVPGKTEEMPSTTKQHQSKLQPKTPKQTPVTPDARREQNNLESFQKAILAFLREKTNNVGKAFDPKSIQEEEKSLERAEVEKLYLIKAKTEEYVQKVAETVTRTLRAYKEARKRQPREKFSKQQKTTTPLSQLFARQGFISAKSDLISFLLSEMTDPVIRALTQTVLDELESEKDGVTVSAAGPDHKDTRQEWQRWEEEARKEEQRLQKLAEHRAREQAAELEEWRPTPTTTTTTTPDTSWAQDLRQREDMDKEKLKAVRDAEDSPRPKGSKSKLPAKGDSKSKDLFKTFTQSAMVLTPRWMKSLKLQTSQVQLFQVDPRAMESPDEKQPFSPRTLLVSAKPLPLPVPEQAQIVDSKMAQISRVSFTPERVQVWGGPPSHEPMKEVQIPPPTAKQEQDLGSQRMAPRILQRTLTPRGSLISEKPPAMQIPQTAEQVPISGVTVTQRAVLPLQQIQGKDITLTSKQALDQGIVPALEPAKEPRITLTPQQAQALGIILTPEQAKAQTISLTPQQAQALALTLTPEQTKEQEISLTPPQAQGLGITLTSEQAQALGLTLTPEQTKAQRVSLSPQQARVLGVSLTPQQAQAQRINLTPEQAQALGIDITPQLALAQTSIFTSQLAQAQQITITPEEAEDLGIALTPQQVKVQGISLTPEQGWALGMALTPDQAQAQGIILTPHQAQALGLTLTPQQVKAQRVCLSPEQAQALGITITPEQAQALGIAITPQLAQAQQITITSEEAKDLGISLTPQQVKVQGISLTPEQGRALGMALTPEQAQAQGIILTPQQAQDLGLTLTPQQVKAQRVCLSPEQAQALGITITPEQAQALGIAITPEQAQALGIAITPQLAQAQTSIFTSRLAQAQQITITPEEAKNLGIALTPQQVKVQGISLTPEQGRALGMALTPEQAQAQGIILTSQQAQTLGLTLTPQQVKTQRVCLSPEQAQALGITITPEQAQVLGIAITPQLAQAQQIIITPEEAEDLGISLTPQQVKVQGISLTPEQGWALGMALTPEQAQAQGIILTPQQAQDLGLTLTPQQIKTQRVCLSPEQAQALMITITSEQAQALGIDTTPQLALAQTSIFTSQLAQAQQITITPEEAEDLGIALTPQQVKVQGISLTPQQGRALGMALTPDQAKAQGIILTPQQAQALGLTLTPQQVKTQRVRLTPERAQALGIAITREQAQALGITLTPKLAQPQEISLSPEEAQALGLTLTPQQAQIQKIFLTPKQAQALGITLTPEQARALKISLTPQQAQVLGITLTREQAKAQRISLTTEQAQVLGITLSLQQAQALGVAPTLKQTAASGITLTPEPGKEKEVSLTRVQALALEISPTPEQTHILGISLSPQQARDLGITLTPRQAKVQKICLTPEQAQALGVTFTPEQAKRWRISLTLEQAQALGITLTSEQAQAHRISLTPEQAETLGITLTPGQAQALGIRFTPSRFQTQGISSKKFQYLEAPLTYEQAAALGGRRATEQIQTLKVPMTPESIQTPKPAVASKQTQTIEIPLTPQLSPASGIPLPQGQGKALGITLMPGQTQSFEHVQALQPPLTSRQAPLLGPFGPGEIQTLTFTIALEKAQNLGVTFTQEQTQAASITLTSEQVAALEDALTEELAWTWGLFTAPEKAAALVPSPDRLLPTSIALQKLKSPLQAPFSPRTSLVVSFLSDSEKLEEPRISPTYRQILADRGQVTPTQLLTPEVPPTLRQLPTPGAPSTPGLPLGHWHSFKPGDTGSSLMPETHLTHRRPTPPLVSGVPPTSGEIPGLFVPGGSAAPFQPLAVHDQAPYMQTYSTPGQPKPSLIIPEQGFSVRTPVSAEAFPVPGRPQRISPSSVSQKRAVAVSPPKPESIRAHPSAALGFEVSPVPFPMEKFQISKFSDILEETRVLQDSPDMKSLGVFQPYVTSSRVPGSKSRHVGEKAPSAREKSIASLPSLTTQLSQTSQITPSERGQRPRLPPIDEPWILSPVPSTRKAKMVGSPLTAQHHEDRYFVDVEAQRKNLAILNQAAQTAGLPSQYHTIARNLIIELLHMNTVRLGYLSRKYVAYRLIQLARNNIIKRLRAIQNTGKGYETQNLFTMLDRIDHYQKKVMWFWTEKQNQLEQRRKHCLWSMMQLFSQLERGFKLNLSQPVPLLSDFKQIPDLPKFQRPVLELLIEDKKPDILKTLGEQAQMEAIWNADLSTSSYPIMEKTSLSTLWAQLGGYPDIPRLLELDIQSTFRKSLASIRSQSKKIPK